MRIALLCDDMTATQTTNLNLLSTILQSADCTGFLRSRLNHVQGFAATIDLIILYVGYGSAIYGPQRSVAIVKVRQRSHQSCGLSLRPADSRIQLVAFALHRRKWLKLLSTSELIPACSASRF
jgi:hypothetical protein